MTTAAISLGGNLGNVRDHFRRAVDRLVALPGIAWIAGSRVFQTQPMGEFAGDPFLNAAMLLEVDLSPEELLNQLQATELELDRKRTIHWGPRTLDLDLLTYGQELIRTPRLTVPHPDCWRRRFVLDPWCDVAADSVHPDFQLTVRELREALRQRPLIVGIDEQFSAPESRLPQLAELFPERDVGVRLCRRSETGWTAPGVPVESRTFSPAFVFCRDAAQPGRREIQAPDGDLFLEFARQAINAALDEPVPCDGDALAPINR